MKNITTATLVLALAGCILPDDDHELMQVSSLPAIEVVSDIPLPGAYERISKPEKSFAEWLSAIRLKPDKRVFLHDGSLKKDQTVQFAVLDIPVGKQDLQQCADAIIRMRAEYLFTNGRYNEIRFRDNNGTLYCWTGANNRRTFETYLQKVFGMCGSASLEKQLGVARDMKDIQPGDVFIKGGFPGHAMLVMDVAINKQGKKIYLLAQSYMPAQDIHIVNNPSNTTLSPWYEVNDEGDIVTPEWSFKRGQLRGW